MDQHRNQSRDRSMPSRSSNMEPAEGSRENVRGGDTGGITNRGRNRERQEQEQLPERGRSQSEGSRQSDEDQRQSER